MNDKDALLRYRDVVHPNARVIWKCNSHEGHGSTGQNGWYALLKEGLVVNGCAGLHTFDKSELMSLLNVAKKGKILYQRSWATDTKDHFLYRLNDPDLKIAEGL